MILPVQFNEYYRSEDEHGKAVVFYLYWYLLSPRHLHGWKMRKGEHSVDTKGEWDAVDI